MATFAPLIRRPAAKRTQKDTPVGVPIDESRAQRVVAPFAAPAPGHELAHVAQQSAPAGVGRALGFAAPALAAPSRAVQAKPKPMDAGPPVTLEQEGDMVLVKVNGEVVAEGKGTLDGNVFVDAPNWHPELRYLHFDVTVIHSARMVFSPGAGEILNSLGISYVLRIFEERDVEEGGPSRRLVGLLKGFAAGPSVQAEPRPPAAPERQRRPPRPKATVSPKVEAPPAPERAPRPPKSTATARPKVEAPGKPTTVPAPKAQEPSPTPPVPERSVASMSAAEKLGRAAASAGRQLGGDFEEALKGLFSLQTLIVLAAWAASHAFGVGEAADAFLALLFGFDVVKSLLEFVFTAIDAKSQEDLDKAGKALAHVVIAIGLLKLGKALGEIGGKAPKAGAEAERAAGEAETAGAREPAEVKSGDQVERTTEAKKSELPKTEEPAPKTEPAPAEPRTSKAPREPKMSEAGPPKAPPRNIAAEVDEVLEGSTQRFNPRVRRGVADLLESGRISRDTLGRIVANVKRHKGASLERTLGYLKALTERNAPGTDTVLSELAHPIFSFYKGAAWVIKWISEKGRWGDVERFEVPSDELGRRWDADIGGTLYQFKSWLTWNARNSATFLKQILEDYRETGGFQNRMVRWVFDTGLGSAEDIIRLMENALDQPNLPKGFTPEIVAEIKAALARIVSAGL